MNDVQKYQVMAILETLNIIHAATLTFHHGDCIGADEQAHSMALLLGYEIVVHPPVSPKKRAYCQGATLYHSERGYLDRNHDIVDASDFMIATPKDMEDVPRGSGTWATIRYATKTRVNLLIVYPDGQIEQRRRTA